MKKIFLLSFLFFSSLQATELAPWFSQEYELQFRTNYWFQTFNRVKQAGHSEPIPRHHDSLLTFSLSITPATNWNVEAEACLADTYRHRTGLDSFRFTGRYLLLDDVAELDPISLSLGLTTTFPFHYRLRDLSVMHHSLIDTELHVAIGKELECGPFWTERAWLLVGLGSGTKGSPWVHGLLKIEKNFCNEHRLFLSANYLQGLGHSPISLDPFEGYAGVAHRSLDLTIGYAYTIPFFGEASLEYVRRVFSNNVPQNLQAASLQLLYLISF